MNPQILVRPAALALLLLLQLMAISLGFDASRPEISASGAWFGFIAQAGQFAKVLVAILVCIVLGLWPRLQRHLETLHRAAGGRWNYLPIAAQLLSFGVFAWFTAAIFGDRVAAGDISDGLVLGWFATLISTALLWLLALAPVGYWRRLAAEEPRVLLAALAVGLAAWWLATYAQSLWTPLSEMTFRLSATLLDLVYPEIFVDAETRRLGAGDFIVNIAPQCSGYEGIGLMAVAPALRGSARTTSAFRRRCGCSRSG